MQKTFNLELDALVVDSFEPQASEPAQDPQAAMIVAVDPLGRAETGCVSGCGGSVCG